jgi:hypothetical protein
MKKLHFWAYRRQNGRAASRQPDAEPDKCQLDGRRGWLLNYDQTSLSGLAAGASNRQPHCSTVTI